MANFNQVILVGRLTRDVETRSFANGGKVAQFAIAISERKKSATGEWKDEAIFIDCKAFNRERSALADNIAKLCSKGTSVMIDGKLSVETWEDKNGGGKRTKVVVIVNEFQLLESRKSQGETNQRPPQGDLPSGGGDQSSSGDDSIPF